MDANLKEELYVLVMESLEIVENPMIDYSGIEVPHTTELLDKLNQLKTKIEWL